VVPNAFVGGFNPERPDPRPNLAFIVEQRAFAEGRRDPAAPGEMTFYLRHDSSALESVPSALGHVLREVEPRIRRRAREFGVRIALGASARQVLSTVIGEGLALTVIGLAAGLLLSLGVAIAVRGALFGVTPTDPQTYAAVFVLLAVVALLACCLPARAATRVDPVRALRQE
jgi:hypothetical protein